MPESNIWWCSPKYADLNKTEIDVKESEIESFEMITVNPVPL
jgi:hypothetical protein